MALGPKLINDPVHGFIELPRDGLALHLLEHPWLQRLRRIRQLSLANLVYPGAQHTRLAHTLGAYWLVKRALETFWRKGVPISPDEYEACQVAMLLHDLGHGPASHGLEGELLPGLKHEALTRAMLRLLNRALDQRLALALDMFEDRYHRPFFHQLIAGQLDMDRMDYLRRDSFYTGVAEGMVGVERLIQTLSVVDDRLVVEQKGIYAVEKFLLARRLMYWQVYLHKTAMAAEQMLVRVWRRARQLYQADQLNWADDRLAYFLDLRQRPDLLEPLVTRFVELDDSDLTYALKQWMHEPDPVLGYLARGLVHRRLLKLQFLPQPASPDELAHATQRQANALGWSLDDAAWVTFAGTASNRAYLPKNNDPILVLWKNGRVVPLPEASDLRPFDELTNVVEKPYLCQPDGQPKPPEPGRLF